MKGFGMLLVAFVIVSTSNSLIAQSNQFASTKAVEIWQEKHALDILNDFRDFLAIPNVATDTKSMEKNADWIEPYLQKRQFKVQRLSAGGAPYIFAERKTAGADKTVLIYAHFDGQPVKPAQWLTPAWSPQLRDNTIEAGGKNIAWPSNSALLDDEWRIFARSAGDDKGPLIAVMAAVDALDHANIDPVVNIKILLDGEEEAGSPTLDKLLEKYGHLLSTDLMLFCDGPMHQSRKRQLVFGVRGVSSVELTTYGPSRPLHSGHYGNWAPNAAEQMVAVLDSLHHKDGRIAVEGFYADVKPITESEKAAIDAMPVIEQALKKDLAISSSRLERTRIEQAIMQPGIIITGIEVGSTGERARNVLVTDASASINFRLVPGQTPEKVRQRIENHFRTLGYHVINQTANPQTLLKNERVLSLEWADGYPAFRADLDSPMARQLNQILTRLDGEPPLMTPTMGGSLPIYLFESVIDAPIIILPIANHDNNQHGPNENIRLGNLWDAIDIYAAVLTEFK